MIPERQPPGWLRRVLELVVRGNNAEFVRADLADDYARQRRERGAAAAAARTIRLAVASAWIMRGRPWQPRRVLGALASDCRFAFRGLAKSPGFTLVTILTLALGIGANAAIFSVVRGVLLEPLPYPEPGRIVNVWQVFREWQSAESEYFRNRAERFPISWPVYGEWVDRSRSFDAIAVYGSYPTIVDGREIAEWVKVVSTTRSFVDVVGVEPALGRWFTDQEDRVGGERVVVVSHRYWQRLGGQASVLGTSLRLHGDPYTVIGVMPQDFYFPDRSHDLWYPVPGGRRNNRFNSQSMSAIARLAPGVSIDEAQREMDAVAEQIIADIPEAIDAGVRVVGRVDEMAGTTADTLRLLASAVALVLLVAAANVAGLLLVRTTARRQEFAVRAALGAKTSRLAAQLMVEGAVLAAVGGTVGLGAVALTFGGLRGLLPADTPRLDDIVVNWQVAGFAAGVSLVVAVVFGLIAVVHLRRRDPVASLGHPVRVLAGSRGRSALVVAEIAISVVLLAVASLLTSSYFRLASVESGIRADGVLTLNVAAPIDIWHDAPDELRAFFAEASSRLETLPGVLAASAVSSLPFSGAQSSGGFGLIENPASEEDTGWSLEQDVSAAYFDAMGIELLAGRTLSDDADGPREAVVNERLARLYFPDRDPLGETIWEDDGPLTIVGVAPNTMQRQLNEQIDPKRYRLFARSGDAAASYVLRVQGDPAVVAVAAAERLRSIGGPPTVSAIATMTELIARTTALPRFRTLLLTALAGLAIGLAAIGLYGVIIYAVATRRREFGLRMTLGAAGPQIARLVLRDGLRLTTPGIALGLLGAAAATNSVASYLYEVDPHDPLILALVALAVVALALAAIALPAWRAYRVDPLVALRED